MINKHVFIPTVWYYLGSYVLYEGTTYIILTIYVYNTTFYNSPRIKGLNICFMKLLAVKVHWDLRSQKI